MLNLSQSSLIFSLIIGLFSASTTALPRFSLFGNSKVRNSSYWGFENYCLETATIRPKQPFTFYLQFKDPKQEWNNAESFKKKFRLCVNHPLRFDSCLSDKAYDIENVAIDDPFDSLRRPITWLTGNDPGLTHHSLEGEEFASRIPEQGNALRINIKEGVLSKKLVDYVRGHVRFYVARKTPLFFLYRWLIKRFGLHLAESPEVPFTFTLKRSVESCDQAFRGQTKQIYGDEQIINVEVSTQFIEQYKERSPTPLRTTIPAKKKNWNQPIFEEIGPQLIEHNV